MEMVWVSALLLATMLVWGLVKVLQLATVWKMASDLEKAQESMRVTARGMQLGSDLDSAIDLELERILSEWEKE
jgi:hypothetical protein